MNLKLLLSNKHTSIAALIYVAFKFGSEIAAAWDTVHADKWRTTANIVEAGAVAYGLLAAGDAKQSAPAEPPAKGADNPISSTPVEPKP
jgi:hypothetical protein